ncbi:MAG: PQQ-binding-like beta-propeller repeat protein [Planctomycetaceae bacterium]|nr:PQQ-binding-like beta-propeller repeat protein [Planctomycetaceae bacterium]
MTFIRFLALTCATGLFATQATADSWPGFRGASGDGVSQETGIPSTWTETEGIAWSTPLRGVGNSSPSIVGGRIYLTSFDAADQSLWVIAVGQKSGELLWEKRVGQGELVAYGPPDLYQHRHNPATATPCVDAEGNVYAFFGTGDLVCLDRDGNEVWRHYFPDEYGPYDMKFGMASSPRLWGDTLFIACVHKGPSYVLALDRKTGKELWLADRNYPAMGDATDAYTSPVVLVQPDRAPQLIVTGCDHVDAYDLATGKRIWFDGSLVLPEEEYARTIASPTVGEGIVVVNSAKNQLCLAIRGDGEGDITGSSLELWKDKGMADCPTATIHNGIVYSVRDEGVGTAFDLKTGKELWRQRVLSGRTQASPVIADGKVYFLALDGQCVVVREGAEYQVVSKNTLPVGDYYATPAISGGMLLVRERSRLYGISGIAAAK